MLPSSNTVSSLARGEKWQIVLLTDMQVGKATILSIFFFFFAFLYTLLVCLHTNKTKQNIIS
jgi:hypothetical protein